MDSFDSAQLMQRILMNEGIEDEEILNRTPERWVDALRALMGTGSEEFQFTTFPSTAQDMVIEQDIPFASLCAHHLLPFFGHAHIAYIPQGRVVGLSKLARVVGQASLGLWSQEELCEEIMHQIERGLSWIKSVKHQAIAGAEPVYTDMPVKPLGVGVIMKAQHTCMSVRGVKAVGTTTTTSSMVGVFRNNENLARSEFLSLIK